MLSLYPYLMLNAAMGISYIGTHTVLSFPAFKNNMLQSQRLKFARFSFISIIGAFFTLPLIFSMFSIIPHSSFELKPLLTSASQVLISPPALEKISIQATPLYNTISLNTFIILFLSFGFTFQVAKYFHNFLQLKKLINKSYIQRQTKNLTILLAEDKPIPFCWSFWNRHYVVIPYAFLEQHAAYQIALRHEFQHIRQGDTRWLHMLAFIKSICFWNPAFLLWQSYLQELQEFACDENLILRKTISPNTYARCLLEAAASSSSNLLPKGVLGMHKNSKSLLFRRVELLFKYSVLKNKITVILAYLISCLFSVTAAYAFNTNPASEALTAKELNAIIAQLPLNKEFHISANNDVLTEINNIRMSEQANKYMQDSLQRMRHYQSTIERELKNNAMPTDLLIIPLVESGYQPLTQDRNPSLAAGIWQFIPSTAKQFGLVVNAKQDDRLDTQQSTNAAIAYLKLLHTQFKDWKLAFIAYEIGANATSQLIQETGSSNAWVIANSPKSPVELKKTLATFDAEFIIMHQPSLLSTKG